MFPIEGKRNSSTLCTPGLRDAAAAVEGRAEGGHTGDAYGVGGATLGASANL